MTAIPEPDAPPADREARRTFLKTAGALALPTLLLPGAQGQAAANDRIQVGVIGLGARGSGHTRAMLGRPDVHVTAVCDVYKSKADKVAGWVNRHYGQTPAGGCGVHQDFRDLLDRGDVDAVIIASPENWHAVQMAEAARTGRDVYGEKSLTHTVPEGRDLVQTVRRHGCVFQTGTQQRSDPKFRRACELALNGALGRVETVHVGVPGGKGRAQAGFWPVARPSPDLDYDLWLGPAQWEPHRQGLCSFQWYFVSRFCVGWIASWGVHHMDIALWGMPQFSRGRIRIEGSAEFFDGTADVSHSWDLVLTAEGGQRLHFVDNSKSHGQGCRFQGSDGWVQVNRGRIWASDPELLTRPPDPGDTLLQVATNHHQDFLDSVRTRRDPVAPVEACHRATALTVAADIATRVRRPLTWDWATQTFVDDVAANRLLTRGLRAPWRV